MWLVIVVSYIYTYRSVQDRMKTFFNNLVNLPHSLPLSKLFAYLWFLRITLNIIAAIETTKKATVATIVKINKTTDTWG